MSNVLIITGDEESLLGLEFALRGDPHVNVQSVPDPEAQSKRDRQAFEYMEAKLLQTEKLMNLAREASARDLEAKRVAEARLRTVPVLDRSLESRAGCWVEDRLGKAHADPIERAARVFEEACEFAQAAGVPSLFALQIQKYVYARKKGDATDEAASVAVTLMAWLWFTGHAGLQKQAVAELDRIEALPQEKIEASLQRKIAAGIVTVQTKVEPDKPEAPELSQAALDDVTEEAIKKLEAADLSPEDFLSYWQRKKRWQERNIR